jgi:hypothetical protein
MDKNKNIQMKGSELIILEGEVKVAVPVKKDACLTFATIFLVVIGVAVMAYFAVDEFKITFNIFYVLVYFVIVLYADRGAVWKFKGNRLITFDDKYIIIYEKMMAISTQKVYKIDNISNLTINRDFEYTFFIKVKSFWNRGYGGCINFDYNGKSIRIGNELTVVEAIDLIEVLKKKHILKEVNLK